MKHSETTTIPAVKKSWSEPVITVLSIKDDTLGGANPGSDSGINDYVS